MPRDTLALACSITMLLVFSVGRGEEYLLHVSTGGNDDNPGTRSRPFATIDGAKKAVRKIVAKGLTSNVTVRIHSGIYELENPLVFTPEDSGTDKNSITYIRDAGAVISGGRRITGWKKDSGGTWTAKVPKGWKFRRLFVDGKPAVRARTPNLSEKETHFKLLGASLSKDAKSYTIDIPPKYAQKWKNIHDVEIVVHGNWAINRKLIEAVDTAAGRLTLAGPHVKAIPWNHPKKGRWSYLENAIEMLDSPGEWYLDAKTGILSYMPRPGEDIDKVVIQAPALEQILVVKGQESKPVRNLHFTGLRFEHTKWQLPPFGYQGIQACHFISSGAKPQGRRWNGITPAIEWRFVESSTITDCAVAHTEGSGISLFEGCRNCTIEGNHIFDIAANGIMLSGPNDEKLVPKSNRIANNYVHHTGQEYFGSVGIWCGFVQQTTLAHNLIHDVPYSGMSVGWMWNPQPTACRNNLIKRNHIYNTMKKLADGGCIYTLGFQPGTILRENHLHDAMRGPHVHGAPNNGVFVDEGSKGYLFERNVIYRTSASHIRFNQCKRDWHTWKDNVLGLPEDADPAVMKDTLYCDGKTAFDAPHKADLDPEKLTVEAWVYMTQYPSGSDSRQWIVNKNDDEWVESYYGLLVSGSGAAAYLNIGGGQKNFFQASAGSDSISLRKWNHLAMTYDGADLVLYVNGKKKATKNINRKRKPGSTPLTIGARQDRYPHGFFKGSIDEVKIYNRALTPPEIAKAASEKKKASLKDMVQSWSFDGREVKTKTPTVDEKKIVMQVKEVAGLEEEYRKILLKEKGK